MQDGPTKEQIEEAKLRANLGMGSQSASTKINQQIDLTNVTTSIEPSEGEAGLAVDAETAIYFKGCTGCTFEVNAVSAKIFVERCNGCTFTFKGKILTSLLEVWRSDDCNITIDTTVKTVQVDMVNKLALGYVKKEQCLSVVWAGAHGLDVTFGDEPDQNLSTSYEDMVTKYPDLSPETDQFICRFLDGVFTQELIVRLPNGYPTTEREAAAWDAQQAIKEKAMREKARAILEANPDLARHMEQKARAHQAHNKGPRIKPNEPCPCGSGKKYKKCCRK